MTKPNIMNCGIFTDSYEAAERILDRIFNKKNEDVKFYRKGKMELNLQLNNGMDYIWIRPIDYSRGYKCSSAYVDLAIHEDAILNIVYPVCIFCDKKTDIEFFDTRGEDYSTLSMLIDALRKVRFLCGDMGVEVCGEVPFRIFSIGIGIIEDTLNENGEWTYKRGLVFNQ